MYAGGISTINSHANSSTTITDLDGNLRNGLGIFFVRIEICSVNHNVLWTWAEVSIINLCQWLFPGTKAGTNHTRHVGKQLIL